MAHRNTSNSRGAVSSTPPRESGSTSLSSAWGDVWRGASPQDIIILSNRSRKKYRTPKRAILNLGLSDEDSCQFVGGVAPSDGRHNILPHHGLESDTKKFIPVIISDYKYLSDSSVKKLGRGRLIIVDTPGYDDTWMLPQDLQIGLGTCLRDMRNKGLDLGGIIYLYDILQTRMPLKKFVDHMEPYKDLLPTPYRSIVLGLTGSTEMQDQIPRKKHLENEHWKEYIAQGSHMMTFPRQPSASHWKALDLIIKYFEDTDRGEAAEDRIYSLLNPKKEIRGRFKWFKRLFIFR